jgi:hypothetical protein
MDEITTIKALDENGNAIETFIYADKIVISNTDSVEIYGTPEQRIELFKDLSAYLGEIKNPENTANNAYLTKKNKDAGIQKDVLYSPLDEVLNTAKPVLSKYGFGLIQAPVSAEKDAGIKTILTHKSGAFISFPILRVPIVQNTAQQVIAAITYARRGALNPILSTHGETDDDGNILTPQPDTNKTADKKQTQPEPKKTAETKPQTKKISPEQQKVLDLANELASSGIAKETISSAMGINPREVTDVKLLNIAYEALTKLKQPDIKKVDLKEI